MDTRSDSYRGVRRLNLRDVVDQDSDRLFEWRNSARIRNVSINQLPLDRNTHLDWLSSAINNPLKHLLIVEWDFRPVGVIQIDNWVASGRFGEWGCYLGEVDVPPGLGASLPLLALGYAFGDLKASRMRAAVLAKNGNMIAIHKRLGMVPEISDAFHNQVDLDSSDSVLLYEVRASNWISVLETGLSLFSREMREAIENCLNTPR